jgi:hypothetical protein
MIVQVRLRSLELTGKICRNQKYSCWLFGIDFVRFALRNTVERGSVNNWVMNGGEQCAFHRKVCLILFSASL